jgi:hypothetical protein
MCTHNPDCPAADSLDACSAHEVAPHHEQGWCLLCNGVILFDDGGAILPNCSTRQPVAA